MPTCIKFHDMLSFSYWTSYIASIETPHTIEQYQISISSSTNMAAGSNCHAHSIVSYLTYRTLSELWKSSLKATMNHKRNSYKGNFLLYVWLWIKIYFSIIFKFFHFDPFFIFLESFMCLTHVEREWKGYVYWYYK